MSSNTRWTREELRAKGFVPDKGGVVRLPAAEWEAKHAAAPAGPEGLRTGAPPSRALNRCERTWLAILQARHPRAIIQPQFRVRISAFDAPTVSHYTADFSVWEPFLLRPMVSAWTCVFWECKDSRRKGHSDELTRPRMCRENNPWIGGVFLAVWDGNAWEERCLA